jgi:hypothetical protein
VILGSHREKKRRILRAQKDEIAGRVEYLNEIGSSAAQTNFLGVSL